MREAKVTRKTKETAVSVMLVIDGSGKYEINTGIGFFDHMLAALSVHAGFDIFLHCKGDIEVDCHHTVEDTGIALGKAFAEALGEKSGIKRFADSLIPMDEALVSSSVDISGRPYLVFNAGFGDSSAGAFDYSTVKEFFTAFAFNSGITLHINQVYGENSHHICEAIFKSVAHTLRKAVMISGDRLLSTKGVL